MAPVDDRVIQLCHCEWRYFDRWEISSGKRRRRQVTISSAVFTPDQAARHSPSQWPEKKLRLPTNLRTSSRRLPKRRTSSYVNATINWLNGWSYCPQSPERTCINDKLYSPQMVVTIGLYNKIHNWKWLNKKKKRTKMQKHTKKWHVLIITPCFRKKTPTHIIGYKLMNSCLILIILAPKFLT